jgi:hypothetical protein
VMFALFLQFWTYSAYRQFSQIGASNVFFDLSISGEYTQAVIAQE